MPIYTLPRHKLCQIAALLLLSAGLALQNDAAAAEPVAALSAKPGFRVGTISVASPETRALIDRWLAEVFRDTGYTPVLELYPGRRLMIELNLGMIDADLGRRVDLSRGFTNIIRLDEPFISVCSVMLTLQKPREQFAELHNKSLMIGTLGGTPDTQSELLNSWPRATIVEFRDMQQAVNLLLHRRVDFVTIPHTHLDMLRALSPLPLDIFKVYPPQGAHMHLNSKHQNLQQALEAGVRRAAPLVSQLNCQPQAYAPIMAYSNEAPGATVAAEPAVSGAEIINSDPE